MLNTKYIHCHPIGRAILFIEKMVAHTVLPGLHFLLKPGKMLHRAEIHWVRVAFLSTQCLPNPVSSAGYKEMSKD